ncbi:MAG: hypothetical protein WBN94_04545 [Methanothrix sp.]
MRSLLDRLRERITPARNAAKMPCAPTNSDVIDAAEIYARKTGQDIDQVKNLTEEDLFDTSFYDNLARIGSYLKKTS